MCVYLCEREIVCVREREIVCVCERERESVCARVCVRERESVCVCVCSLIHLACSTHEPCLICGLPGSIIFFHIIS